MSLFFKVFFSPLVHMSEWMLVLFDHVLFISSFFLCGVWFRPHRCCFCGFNECVNLSITKDLLHSHACGGKKWHVFIKLSFAEAKANGTIISPAVWFGISALECFLFSLCVVQCTFCLSRDGLGHKTQVWGRKRGESRRMEICRELCLTKCSNIILSSRISTHALKVHLPSRCSSLPFLSLSKHSSRCGLVTMATVCITQPGLLDFSFRCSWVTALTGNVLPYTRCPELYN